MTTYADRQGSFSSFRPATDAQLVTLKRMISERDITAIQAAVDAARQSAMAGTFSLQDASHLFDLVKAQPRKAPEAELNRPAPLAPGVYRGSVTGEGSPSKLYRVYPARATDRPLLAKEIIHEAELIRFEYVGAARRFVDPSGRLTLEEAKEFGHQYGICVMCGARLTDPESVAAGIGPICAGKIG